MPIVTCPNCQRRYDPGVDDDVLNDLAPDASMKVVCPACGQWARLPENEACEAPNAPAHVLEAMKGQSRLVDGDDRPSRSGRRRSPDEDDRPSRSARRRPREVEDDDRPRPRRRRDEDDDDRPSRRGRAYRDPAEEDYSDDPGTLRNRPRRGGDGMGQGAMITGIISLCVTVLSAGVGCLCVFAMAGVVLGMIGGVVAVILGFVARSRTPGSGMGLTGILTGFGSILIGLVLVVLMIVGVGFLALNAPPPNKAGGPGNPNFGNPRRF